MSAYRPRHGYRRLPLRFRRTRPEYVGKHWAWGGPTQDYPPGELFTFDPPLVIVQHFPPQQQHAEVSS